MGIPSPILKTFKYPLVVGTLDMMDYQKTTAEGWFWAQTKKELEQGTSLEGKRVFGVQTGSHCFFMTSWYPQIPKGWLWTELWILKVNGSGSKWPPKLEGNFLLPTFLRVRPKWYQLNHRIDDRLKTEHGEHWQNKMKQDEATWDK